MQDKAHRRMVPLTHGRIAPVLTLAGIIKLRDDLHGHDREQVAAQFKDSYFRDEHGALRRVFPKKSKRG